MNVRVFAVVASIVVLPGALSAQAARRVVPATRQVRPGALRATITPQGVHPVHIGPHTYYGTIASLAGTTLVLRTRHQRMVTIDATSVIADGTYSAPLFVGKLVTIDGTRAASGVFTAAHILRMTNLEALPDDH